ncbi:PREDICTED: uncharacterized protein LOC106816525, partial [Priapulus caudatus]|uniref:Uncharacterized protein LOC106816525 n=1 Tax=Priapulus caudatus TaxID=37621 RepID=A0ABM1EWR7_PRICU
MASAAPWRLLAAFVAVATLIAPAESQFRWQVWDRYDEIQSRIDLVTMQNCRTRQAEDLFLPMSTVPAIPHITDVDPKYPNRTNLYHVHNTALNRGFFYSFIYNLEPDNAEPGLLYQYKSLTADILGNKWVNASGVFFDVNGTYPNFYRDFFNRTLPLYGPHAIRYDDFNEPTNPCRSRRPCPSLRPSPATPRGPDWS